MATHSQTAHGPARDRNTFATSVFVKQPRRAKTFAELEAVMIGSTLWQTPKRLKDSIKAVASSWSNSCADNCAHMETWCCERAILHPTAKQQRAGRLLCPRLRSHRLRGWPPATPSSRLPPAGHISTLLSTVAGLDGCCEEMSLLPVQARQRSHLVLWEGRR